MAPTDAQGVRARFTSRHQPQEMAGFEVSLNGRIWVSTEATHAPWFVLSLALLVLAVDRRLYRLQEQVAGHLRARGDVQRVLQVTQLPVEVRASELPALKRVLVFSMWMSRTFVRDTVKIRDEELAGHEGLAEERLWPVWSMTLEEWGTHTAVFDHSGYRRTIYHHAGDDSHWPSVLCRHELSGLTGERQPAALEVVLWDGAIRCWAREGRFRGKHWSGESEDEHEFITIPLDRPQLDAFLRPDDEDSVEAPYRYSSKPWHREYRSTQDERLGWSLRVTDHLAFATR